MKEALALIDQLIEEHKKLKQNTEAAEQAANDIDAMLHLDKTKGDFVPGKPGEQQQALKNLHDSLALIE